MGIAWWKRNSQKVLSPHQDQKHCWDDTDNTLSHGRPACCRTSFSVSRIQCLKFTPLFITLANIYSAWSPQPRARKEPEAEAESPIFALLFPPFTFSTSTSLHISLSYLTSASWPTPTLTSAVFFQNINLRQLTSVHTHTCLCQDSVFQLKQLCPHQAVASTQVALSLCHPARVTPACPSFNSSADAHGKPGFLWGKGKLLIQLNAGAWGRCLWRLVVRPGLPSDRAELSSLPPVYFFKWHRAPLYFPVRLVKLMSGNDLYWFDRLPRARRSALTTESYLITTKRWRISGNLKDLSQGIWIKINAENMSSSAKLHHSFLTVKIVILKSSRSYRKQPSARWSYRDALSHLKWKTHCSWTSHTWTFPRRGSSTSKLTSRLCMFLISHLTGKHTILSPGVLTRPGLRSTWTDRGGQGGWHPLWGMGHVQASFPSYLLILSDPC